MRLRISQNSDSVKINVDSVKINVDSVKLDGMILTVQSLLD
jgi:hypothetical protein